MIIVRDFSKELVKHSPFASGEPSLDQWLKEQAGQQDRRNGVRTFLAADEAAVRIAGYYSTVTYQLTPEDAGETFGRISRYPIPAILLARLAVDGSYQGSGDRTAAPVRCPHSARTNLARHRLRAHRGRRAPRGRRLLLPQVRIPPVPRPRAQALHDDEGSPSDVRRRSHLIRAVRVRTVVLRHHDQTGRP